MSINNFIPVVWSARHLDNLNKSLVLAQANVVNRDYEGEIQAFGDSVKLNSIGRVTVGDYTKNTNIGDPETLTDAQRTLTINQSKYFNFQVDDVDKAQQKPKVMDSAMAEAAYAIKNAIDSYVAAQYVDVSASAPNNKIGDDTTPKVIGTGASEVNAYDALVSLKTRLDNANVPDFGRWVAVPPWFHNLLLLDERFVKYGGANQEKTLLNGAVGRVSGIDVLMSNNVHVTGSKYHIMAGHPMAISLALQINNVEAYRPQQRFADAVKGLALYGAKVVRPEALAVLTATQGAGLS